MQRLLPIGFAERVEEGFLAKGTVKEVNPEWGKKGWDQEIIVSSAESVGVFEADQARNFLVVAFFRQD